MSSFRNVNTGVDLDSIFAARVTLTAPVTGYRNLDGQDLNVRYEGYNGFNPASPVGYRGPDGRDISLYFATSAGAPIDFVGYGSGENAIPNSTAIASITFTPEGRVVGGGSPSGGGGTNLWFSAPRTGIGNDYDVSVSTMSAGPGTPGGTFNTWLQLDQTRQFTLTVSGNQEVTRTATAQIRRRSDNVVVCSGPLEWFVNVGVPI